MIEEIKIGSRKIGPKFPPFIIPEIGINHNGDYNKAKKMIRDAHASGAECVKFQCHIVDDEMIENSVVPPNAKESIWKMMKRCSLSKKEDVSLKKYVEKLGMIYLSTPFSRSAVDRLEEIGVIAYKIGSGECNNFPLLEYIATKGKPIILSTGMNTISDVSKAIKIFKKTKIKYAILHVTSQYPTSYENVRLRALSDLKNRFPNIVIGLSDHSIGNYTCFAGIPLGACILEKHFTSNKRWEGSDIPISIDPDELRDLIQGSNSIFKALGKKGNVLQEELKVAKFAFSCVVAIKNISKGQKLSSENIWVKRPGTGEIYAENYNKILNKTTKIDIKKNTQLEWNMFE